MRVDWLRGRHPIAEIVSSLLIFFIVLFPKGGLKLGLVPVTWGYLLLATIAPLLVLYGIVALPWRVRPASFAAYASTVPFQVIFLYSYIANGVGWLSYAISVVVNFFFLPPVFLLVLPAFYPWLDAERFRRQLCSAIFWTAVFGIFLFFWWPFTGKLIEIPFLTVNLADYGTVAQTKHIYRGPFLKLISTYNNGNVYGVAMLIILPLYSLIEPKRWRRNTLRLALFLTLARTVWAGLIVEQLLGLAQPFFLSLGSFPRLRLGGAGRRLFVIGAVMLIILLFALSNPSRIAYVYDPTLGGRIGELSMLREVTPLPTAPVTGFAEVLFASALVNYGVIGAAAFFFIFALPVLMVVARPQWLGDPVRRMALKGMVLYVIVSASDGATNLIPVMAFFWFTYSVYLVGMPGTQGVAATMGVPARAPQTMPGIEGGWIDGGVMAADRMQHVALDASPTQRHARSEAW